MAALINKISQSYNFPLYELQDYRTRDFWPGFGSLATILLCYIYFCKKAGPAWMKNRKPYDLTTVIFYYNIFQVVVSTYLSYQGFTIYFLNYDLTCQPVSMEDCPLNKKVHNLVWIYTAMKFIELLDTVFFVLRKKDRQISSLHLYHHFGMPICALIGLKFFPNGHGAFLGVINSFVHMIMYTYYLIAGLGPEYQKHLWWKQHVTSLQLTQFVMIFIHNMYPLFTDCSFPKWVNGCIALCSLHFVYMFGNFYYNNYIKTNRRQDTNQKTD